MLGWLIALFEFALIAFLVYRFIWPLFLWWRDK